MANDARLFLDSNVILSGLLSSKGAPRILLDLLSLRVPLIRGLTGQYNLDEIERNLKVRFPDLLPIYRDYLPKLHLETIEIPAYSLVEALLGKMSAKDAPVLASAQLGHADFLVTGDKKGFPKALANDIQVVSPADFLNRYLPKIIQQPVK